MKRWRCSFFKWQNFLIRPPTQQLTQHQRASSNITDHFQQHPTLITRRNPTLPTRRYPSTPTVAEHQPTLPKSWITYPTSRSITRRHPKWSNQHYPTSSNITQHHPSNITWPYPISSNIIQSTLRNVSQYYPTNIIQYHPTSPNQHYTTSSYITTQHHPVSSNITDHQPPLISSAQLHCILPNITWYQPTSSNIKDVNKFSKIAITICFIFSNFVHLSSFVFAVLFKLFFTVFYIYCAWLNFFNVELCSTVVN